MPTVEANLNDTTPTLQVRLLRGTVAVSLTGLAASAILFLFYRSSLIASVPATAIDDAAGGVVSVTPPAAVIGTAGTYTVYVRVTFADGTIQTFPLRAGDRLLYKVGGIP